MTAPDYTELREDWLRNLRLETSGASLCEIEAIAIGGSVLKLSDLLALLEHDDTAIAELQAQVEAMREANSRLSDILDTERYKVAIALGTLKKAIDGRRWLSEPGRGSYTYDDERYQQEFGGALEEINAALNPLRAIATDWSDCPRDPIRVEANRRAALQPKDQSK